MNILITGAMGYIGPALARHLRQAMPNAHLIGYDTGYFAHCLTGATVLPESLFDAVHFGDVRSFPAELLKEVDGVVHLAAVSNDPMGKRFEAVTDAINHRASVDIFRKARDAGVGHFVFASSCSIYGFAAGGPRSEGDALNPLTAYARSKVDTEVAMAAADPGAMTVTALRFATACGMSDRTRLDLVLNDFVASALATGVITVLSDGSPWRPLIDIKDMSRAIHWALIRPNDAGGANLAVNAGSDVWNYQVRDLAQAVADQIPGTRVSIATAAPPDKRSYRVDFRRFAELAQGFTPQIGLEQTVRELKEGLSTSGFADPDFRNSQYMRLKVLERHISEGRLTEDLRWTSAR